MKRHQVVVIGAGVGGLTAAAMLARAGYDVTVLESHVDPGGCAATFYHKGYRFDAGATLVGGFQPGGPHQLAGEALNIEWPVHAINPAMQVWLPDVTITRYGDGERWRAERQRVFKQPAAERFWQAQERIADRVWGFAGGVPPFPPVNAAEAVRLAGHLRLSYASLLPYVFRSVRGWADSLGASDPTLGAFLDGQLLISAQTTAQRANALYGATALDMARQGVFHVSGGVGAIAEQLAAALVRWGGRIVYRQEVTQIEVKQNAVVAVRTRKGGRWEAGTVIANLTPWNLKRLLGEEQPASTARPSMWGAFMLYLGIDAEAVPSSLASDHHQIILDPTQPLGEGNSIFVSLSPAWDHSRAPAGQRALTVSTHTDIRPWWELREAGGQQSAYEARRDLYGERLLQGVEQILPGIRRHIRLHMPGTPVTFQDFTRRYLGMVGGFPQHSLLAARGPSTGVDNLWLVGDSIFPGQSTAGVTLGGLRVSESIQRQGIRPLARLWEGMGTSREKPGDPDPARQRTLAGT